MQARLIKRPVVGLISGRTQCISSFSTTTVRHELSYRRTKQKLNVKPDVSFLSSGIKSQQDHIIFNPPSSAPSVLHTPLIFLPKEDKRKPLFEKVAMMYPALPKLPPIIKRFKPVGVRHHLTDTDIKEIRSLRTSDPDHWTARRLAYKYKCSIFFITMCCEAPAEKKERDREKEDAMKARWGPRRRKAREDREKRIQLALRDV